MKGKFFVEEVTQIPEWSATMEGRRVYFEGYLYYANNSCWQIEDASIHYPSDVAGFAAGGYSPATSTIDKLLFSNDNVASIISRLTQAKHGAAGFEN